MSMAALEIPKASALHRLRVDPVVSSSRGFQVGKEDIGSVPGRGEVEHVEDTRCILRQFEACRTQV